MISKTIDWLNLNKEKNSPVRSVQIEFERFFFSFVFIAFAFLNIVCFSCRSNRKITSFCFSLLGLEFFETSAKENVNVKVVFERYIRSFVSPEPQMTLMLLFFLSIVEDWSILFWRKCLNHRTIQMQLDKRIIVMAINRGAYNKGTTRLTANDQQTRANQCQC